MGLKCSRPESIGVCVTCIRRYRGTCTTSAQCLGETCKATGPVAATKQDGPLRASAIGSWPGRLGTRKSSHAIREIPKTCVALLCFALPCLVLPFQSVFGVCLSIPPGCCLFSRQKGRQASLCLVLISLPTQLCSAQLNPALQTARVSPISLSARLASPHLTRSFAYVARCLASPAARTRTRSAARSATTRAKAIDRLSDRPHILFPRPVAIAIWTCWKQTPTQPPKTLWGLPATRPAIA